MTREEFLVFCEGLEGASTDRPFRGDLETTVARHTRGGRWFAILMRGERGYFVNLKCEPVSAALLRGMFEGIRPGYHMNKNHWISVDLAGDVPRELICRLTADSHRLTAPRFRKARRQPGEGT